MTSKDDKHSLLWWGVSAVRPQASAPGALELEGRGDNATWPRDRHTQVRLCVCFCVLGSICPVSRKLPLGFACAFLTRPVADQPHPTTTNNKT